MTVEEKVDGSQFSFGLMLTGFCDLCGNEEGVHPRKSDPTPYGTADHDFVNTDTVLMVRSKGATMHPEAPEGMFRLAVEYVKSVQTHLHLGWTYRGEVLCKPKHNALAYDRVPRHNIIIFDINSGDQEYLDYDHKVAEAARIGLETVPKLFEGKIGSIEEFRGFLDTVSVLGGQKIEGVVIKPVGYNLWGIDKKCLLGKFVSEAYKEVHRKSWGEDNPAGKDILGQIGDRWGTQTRWNKAIQHFRDDGKLEGSPRDIGPLIREIPEDIFSECEDEIRDYLMGWARPHIRRLFVRGFAQYYKDLLLKSAFESPEQGINPQESVNDELTGIRSDGPGDDLDGVQGV